MNLLLWIAQILAGTAFIMAGVMKTTRPIPELAKRMTWVPRHSPAMVRFIGVAELLGGLGLIVPWATHIAPVLTPIAALALFVVMLLAFAEHVRYEEWKLTAPGLVLGGLAAFVALGRW